MRRILLDTGVISSWHGGEQRYARPLERLFRDLGRTRTTLYVSSVTIQELGSSVMGIEAWPTVTRFLSASRINMLAFCAGCAIAAARLRVEAGPSSKEGKAAFKAAWHHDAAIVGTAAHHGLDLVVTADRALATCYGGFFSEIYHLLPDD